MSSFSFPIFHKYVTEKDSLYLTDYYLVLWMTRVNADISL